MPELPEVEVVKRSLKNNLVGQKLKKVKINNYKLRFEMKIEHFKKIIGHKIKSIERRSKYLIISFNNNFSLLVHLGMTGKFFIMKNNKKIEKTSFYYSLNSKSKKHDHVEFDFKVKKLIYNDVRKFGFIKVLSKEQLLKTQHLNSLGPEPLTKKFNFNYFKLNVKNTDKSLKNLLMNQKFVAGLGNIYVNEVLFLSKLNPNKSSILLSDKDIKIILANTKKILIKSIKNGGSSIKNFSNSDGSSGNFQRGFKVYSRNGKKCLRRKCSGIIAKNVISNRSTFFCNICQK